VLNGTTTDELQDVKEVAIVYFKVLSGIHVKGLRKTIKTPQS
jgi:hypothetical protein